MNPTILVLIGLAAVGVLCGVAYAVMGKGGQLARFEADHPPLNLPEGRGLAAGDLVGVTLPLALWGYHVRGVDEVLRRVSVAIHERDEHIAELEERLASADASTGPRVLYPRTPPVGVRLDAPAEDGKRSGTAPPKRPEASLGPAAPQSPQGDAEDWDGGDGARTSGVGDTSGRHGAA